MGRHTLASLLSFPSANTGSGGTTMLRGVAAGTVGRHLLFLMNYDKNDTAPEALVPVFLSAVNSRASPAVASNPTASTAGHLAIYAGEMRRLKRHVQRRVHVPEL